MHVLRTLLLLSLSALPVHAGTFQVSQAGSDSTLCGVGPRRTIAAGIACLQSGDTLEIAGGTYAECLSNSGQFTATPLPAGRPGAPTTLRAAAGATVWLKPGKCPADREGGGVIALEGKRDLWLVFDGINIDGGGAGGNRQGLTVSARHNVFRHMTIQNVERQCINSFSEHGDAEPRFYNLFEDLLVHHCGVVPDDVGSHGAYINSWNNTFHRFTARDNNCNGLQFSHEGGQSQGNVITDSLFANNGCTGVVAFPGNVIDNSTLCNNAMGVDGYALQVRNSRIFANRVQNLSLKGGGHVLEGNSESGSSADCPAGAVPAGPPSRPTPAPKKRPAPTNLRVVTVPLDQVQSLP